MVLTINCFGHFKNYYSKNQPDYLFYKYLANSLGFLKVRYKN